MKIPQPKIHPLKKTLKRVGLKYWQVAQMLGTDEASMSRWMNGIRDMPDEVEARIKEIVAEAGKQ